MLNLRALFQEIPEARQYIESGVLVGSKTVTVYSLAHVQTYVNGDYERGTLKSPFDFSTLPDECTPISKPVAAAESPEGEESAQPSTPPSTEFIPTTLADLDVDTKRFVVAPEVIIQFEDQILRHWTNKILDDYLQREILAEHNHRGTAYTFLSRWVCMRADLDGRLWPRHGESNPDSQRACSLGEPSWRATPAKVGRDFSLVQS